MLSPAEQEKFKKLSPEQQQKIIALVRETLELVREDEKKHPLVKPK